MRPPIKTPALEAPWKELDPLPSEGGYLTIYYSDNMSYLPARWVTKPGDNKSDPNIETLSYGLFSTCAPAMRRAIVNRRCKYLFFGTAWRGQRVLSGYYQIRWSTRGPLGATDLCLAADKARFLKNPLPFSKVDAACGTNISSWFRGMRRLTEQQCRAMLKLINSKPDATQAYLDEIDRLERFNIRYGGFRYIGWKQVEKFSWSYAKSYFEKWAAAANAAAIPNSSRSGVWQCASCKQNLKNKALLKRCPNCGAMGTLRPTEESNG